MHTGDPNIPKATELTGSDPSEMQAKGLLELGAKRVLITGSHGAGKKSTTMPQP